MLPCLRAGSIMPRLQSVYDPHLRTGAGAAEPTNYLPNIGLTTPPHEISSQALDNSVCLCPQ